MMVITPYHSYGVPCPLEQLIEECLLKLEIPANCFLILGDHSIYFLGASQKLLAVANKMKGTKVLILGAGR